MTVKKFQLIRFEKTTLALKQNYYYQNFEQV